MLCQWFSCNFWFFFSRKTFIGEFQREQTKFEKEQRRQKGEERTLLIYSKDVLPINCKAVDYVYVTHVACSGVLV